jgi:hypothetical protein
MMEAARSSETLVNFYQTIRRYNPEDSQLRPTAVRTSNPTSVSRSIFDPRIYRSKSWMILMKDKSTLKVAEWDFVRVATGNGLKEMSETRFH